jgi:hypothetical protein
VIPNWRLIVGGHLAVLGLVLNTVDVLAGKTDNSWLLAGLASSMTGLWFGWQGLKARRAARSGD